MLVTYFTLPTSVYNISSYFIIIGALRGYRGFVYDECLIADYNFSYYITLFGKPLILLIIPKCIVLSAPRVLSESVANVIEFCDQELGLINYKNSDGTVDFIRRLNNLFDILNLRNLRAFGYKKPLSPNNFDQVKTFLDETYKYIKSLKIADKTY